MSTTDLVAELVVGGFQTLIWVTLLIMIFFGLPAKVPSLGSWVVDAGFVLCSMYTFGVLFDKMWDIILSITRFDKLVRGKPKLSTNDLLRQKVFVRDPSSAAEFVSYNRSRMRIARASAFNFAMMTICGAVLAPKLTLANKGDIKTTVLLIGPILTIIAAISYVSLSRTYERSLLVASATSA